MLALQGYGSSDENSEGENECKTEIKKSEVRVDQNVTDILNNEETLSKMPINSLALQICAAPEVVPTVSLLK